MYDEDSQLDTAVPATGRGLLAVTLLVPMVAVASLIVGVGLGGAVAWYAKPAPQAAAPEAPTYDLADIRFQQACLPMVAEKANRIEELNLEIGDLRNQVTEKADRVAELEARTATAKGGAKTASAAELRQAKEELASLRLQYASLTSEKDQLVVSLTQSRQQLEVAEVAVAQNRAAYEDQVSIARVARDDASSSKYASFLGDSQLAICEKGGRKKMGDCRTDVLARLQDSRLKDQFMQCVRTGQATPSVREMLGGGSLPSHSAWLDDGSKVLKGWYVTMCDPTLPEADLVAARPAEYRPMSAFETAASYLPSASAMYAAVMPTAMAAPTSALLPDAFVPAEPATGRLEEEPEPAGNPYFPTVDPAVLTARVAAPVAPAYVPPPAPVAASNAQYADLLDIDDLLGPPSPAAAPPVATARNEKEELPTRSYDSALDDDLSDLPEE